MKQQRIVIVAAVAIVVVLGAWFGALWHPETSRLKSAQASESAAVVGLSTVKDQLVALKSEEPMVAREAAVLRDLIGAVPNGPSLDQMLRTINAAAIESGAAITSVGTPQPAGWGAASSTTAAAQSGPTSMTVALGVEGTDAQLLKLVTALNSEPRLYVITALSLSATLAGGGVGSTGLTVEAFFVPTVGSNPLFSASTPLGE
jgi:Tfp pilus assembly protein PilO